MATLGGLQAGLSSYTPTWAERIPNAIQDGLTGLGMDKYTARRVFAQPVADALSWSPVGAVTGAVDQARAAFNAPSLMGKLAHGGLAAMNMAALPIPGMGGAVARVAERGAAHLGEHLAMDEGSRMARAAEQGFDTTTPLYHGTGVDFDSFRASPSGSYGPGVYATTDRKAASSWANDGGLNAVKGLSASPQVMPVFAKGPLAHPDAPLDPRSTNAFRDSLDSDHRENFDEAAGDPDLFNLGPSEALWGLAPYRSAEAQASLKAGGYTGFRPAKGKAGESVVYDPANIRSKFAAFDPRNASSANLLGGLAAGVVGAKYLSQPQPDTQQPQ